MYNSTPTQRPQRVANEPNASHAHALLVTKAGNNGTAPHGPHFGHRIDGIPRLYHVRPALREHKAKVRPSVAGGQLSGLLLSPAGSLVSCSPPQEAELILAR